VRSDLRRLRQERYQNQQQRVKVIKKLGKIKRERALAFRDFDGPDFMDYDPNEWFD